MSKHLGQGCGKDIGGWSCGEFLEEYEDEDGRGRGQYYYCEECHAKFEQNDIKNECPSCGKHHMIHRDNEKVCLDCGGVFVEK